MHESNFVAAYDWDQIYNDVSRAFGGEPVPDVAELVTGFCHEDGMITLLPGAEACLGALSRAGYRMVAITNGFYAYQWPVLKALKIAPFLMRSSRPIGLGFAKPKDMIFRRARSDVHVGNTLLHDVLGANQAGITSVWLDANLPEDIRELPAANRARHNSFQKYLCQAFDAVPTGNFIPKQRLTTALQIMLWSMHTRPPKSYWQPLNVLTIEQKLQAFSVGLRSVNDKMGH